MTDGYTIKSCFFTIRQNNQIKFHVFVSCSRSTINVSPSIGYATKHSEFVFYNVRDLRRPSFFKMRIEKPFTIKTKNVKYHLL
jgi:hypothetical protein